MKKNYLLLLLITTLIISSCKKDESSVSLSTNVDKIDVSSSNYYKVGTVLDSTKKSIVHVDKFKLDYVSFPPEANDPTLHPNAASFNYKIATEVARSENGLYSVFFQADGNLVLYKRSSANGPIGAALWATNYYLPHADPSNSNVPPVTTFQTDGNIICRGLTNNIYWTSGYTSGPSAIWILQDDGNFVGYSNFIKGSTFIITGSPFASTATDGGKFSKFFGRMAKIG